MLCTGLRCACGRCGTSGPGDIVAMLARAAQKAATARLRDAEHAKARIEAKGFPRE